LIRGIQCDNIEPGYTKFKRLVMDHHIIIESSQLQLKKFTEEEGMLGNGGQSGLIDEVNLK